jgi:hypothetical protein
MDPHLRQAELREARYRFFRNARICVRAAPAAHRRVRLLT